MNSSRENRPEEPRTGSTRPQDERAETLKKMQNDRYSRKRIKVIRDFYNTFRNKTD